MTNISKAITSLTKKYDNALSMLKNERIIDGVECEKKKLDFNSVMNQVIVETCVYTRKKSEEVSQLTSQVQRLRAEVARLQTGLDRLKGSKK